MEEEFKTTEETIIDAPVIKRWSYEYMVNNAFAVIVVLLISLIIIVIFPRYPILLGVAVGVSIAMGFIMEQLFVSDWINTEFTQTEKIIISGGGAGLAGFTAGYFAKYIIDVIPFIES